jgi:hypothetical protein
MAGVRRFGLGFAFAARRCRRWLLVLAWGIAPVAGIAPAQATLCGGAIYPFPYTDVAAVGAPFCPGIMEAYVTGVSKGTTPTTFSPNNTVSRVQMTTFLQRSLDQGLARSSRRAALNQWWTPQITAAMQSIAGVSGAIACAADGDDIWVSSQGPVIQLQASTGNLLGTWTGAGGASNVLVAAGRVFVTGLNSPGDLYLIDPTQPPGAVFTAVSTLGAGPQGIAFDGTHIWTANLGGSVSIITPQASTPYPASNVSTGFMQPFGVLYDGAHIWVTDFTAGALHKLDPAGAILQTVPVGSAPAFPVFDGTNIWVPNLGSNSITVVQASSGTVVATIGTDTNNKLNSPYAASFDGERVLVTNDSGSSVTLFKAADLSLLANVTVSGSSPNGACNDGINFWITVGTGNLQRF